ncbi:MAG: aminoacyl-tRNA hydrolase, partial [Acutalibacteraceae bacterium]
MLFTRKDNFSSKTYEYMIVGLGNPGKKYEFTRHNAGFLFVDILCDKYNFSVDRLKFKALIGDVKINSHRCLVMKPQTMMNLSGDAVKEAADFYKIPPEKIIVVFDD